MKEVVETFIGGALAIAVTLKGLNDFFKEATTVLGFFTTLVGFVTGILILIWWTRKLRGQRFNKTKQKHEIEIET